MGAALEGGATVRHNFGVPLLPLQRRSATAISLGAARVGAPFQGRRRAPLQQAAGEYCMSRPWPQERNTSLSFALRFLREPQS